MKKIWNKRTALWLISIIVAVAVTFCATTVFYLNRYGSLAESITKFEKIARVLTTFDAYYIEDPDWNTMTDNGLKAMIASSGDKYGMYFDKETYKNYSLESDGQFAGIGVNVIYDTEAGGMFVTSLFENSPAQKAGILPGDMIIKVFDEYIKDIGYYSAVDKMRGKEGTEVVLTVLRGDNELTVKATRTIIDLPSVEWKMLDNDIAYIRFIQFHSKTPEEFNMALKETDGAKGYIFDVRNNPGGELGSIVDVLDVLLPEGVIVTMRDNLGNEKVYPSGKDEIDAPMAVLINESTYSAAELFAAAMKDYDKAKLVGITTYGKGVAQAVIEFGDGSALSVTNNKFFPPSDVNFNGIGVTPHIEVSMPEDLKNNYTIEDKDDPQLMTAIDVLTN